MKEEAYANNFAPQPFKIAGFWLFFPSLLGFDAACLSAFLCLENINICYVQKAHSQYLYRNIFTLHIPTQIILYAQNIWTIYYIFQNVQQST